MTDQQTHLIRRLWHFIENDEYANNGGFFALRESVRNYLQHHDCSTEDRSAAFHGAIPHRLKGEEDYDTKKHKT